MQSRSWLCFTRLESPRTVYFSRMGILGYSLVFYSFLALAIEKKVFILGWGMEGGDGRSLINGETRFQPRGREIIA